MPDFLLPDLGEGLTEAEIIRWLVGIGDQVAVDQPVVEVETAKATVELPSPFSGKVQALHGAAGDSVSVGAALLTVEAATPADGGPVLVGYGISDSAGRAKRSRVARERNSSTPSRAGVISPLVRRLAHDHGVDVRQVRGSGPDGIVLRHDIESVIARQAPDAGESTRAQPTMVSGRFRCEARAGPRSTDCLDHVVRFPRRRYGSTLTRPSCSRPAPSSTRIRMPRR